MIILTAAFFLDLLMGDPSWFPHPVRGIGYIVSLSERIWRRIFPENEKWKQRIAGFFAWSSVLLVVGGIGFGLLCIINPIARIAVSVYIIYSSMAVKDLMRHALRVFNALEEGDLLEARRRAGYMVSRNTAELEEKEIVRAVVESVAENTSDSITAPLFYAGIFGPLGALVYRTVNTMDAMYGYKNERYRDFGFWAAKSDDVINLLPARLCGLLYGVAAFFLGDRSGNSFRILLRDAKNHESPNGGFPEAAVAGALRIRLGGPSRYFGKLVAKPYIGDEKKELERGDIKKVVNLMLVAASISLLFSLMLWSIMYFSFGIIFNVHLLWG